MQPKGTVMEFRPLASPPDVPAAESSRPDPFPDKRFETWWPSRMSDELVEGEATAYLAAVQVGLTRETFFGWLVARRYVGGWEDPRPAEPKRLRQNVPPLAERSPVNTFREPRWVASESYRPRRR